jgi:hypothetical protein
MATFSIAAFRCVSSPSRSILRASVGSLAVTNGFGVQRQEKAVCAVGALDSRFFTNAANPFIGTSRRISRVAGCAALEPASIHIRAPSEQPAKQRDLFLCIGAVVDHARRVHRTYDTAHFVSFAPNLIMPVPRSRAVKDLCRRHRRLFLITRLEDSKAPPDSIRN